jgi:hypothetical protein
LLRQVGKPARWPLPASLHPDPPRQRVDITAIEHGNFEIELIVGVLLKTFVRERCQFKFPDRFVSKISPCLVMAFITVSFS